ncbi:MAG: alpha/beta hydrolase [Stenotrophomonas acidaminiphila]|nr:MAG: alpha/beta hydrolase [Stenotrophomonas acidaminiphila]
MDIILSLGPELFGLLTLPEQRQHSVAVILLNAGFIHRAGPYRMGTRLARLLGDAGYPVLRFDLPGIGDSIDLADRPETDVIRGVLDAVAKQTGCQRFVIGGLCAAADAGWKVAVADPRVEGLILLDGIARKGAWATWARLRRLVRKPPSAWLAAMRNLRGRPQGTQDEPRDITDAALRDWPAVGAERMEMQLLVGRGVRVFALYTGGTSYFLHPRQFRATFGRSASAPEVSFVHWPESDHVFHLDTHRQRLIERIRAWLQASFPPPAT